MELAADAEAGGAEAGSGRFVAFEGGFGAMGSAAAADSSSAVSPGAPTIRIKDADPEAFLEVLRFLHSSRCVLTPATCVPILELANRFGLPELTSLVGAQMGALVDVANVCSLLEASDRLGPPALRERCLAFAQENIVAVMETEAFKDLHAARPGLALGMLKATILQSRGQPAAAAAAGGGASKQFFTTLASWP